MDKFGTRSLGTTCRSSTFGRKCGPTGFRSASAFGLFDALTQGAGGDELELAIKCAGLAVKTVRYRELAGRAARSRSGYLDPVPRVQTLQPGHRQRATLVRSHATFSPVSCSRKRIGSHRWITRLNQRSKKLFKTWSGTFGWGRAWRASRVSYRAAVARFFGRLWGSNISAPVRFPALDGVETLFLHNPASCTDEARAASVSKYTLIISIINRHIPKTSGKTIGSNATVFRDTAASGSEEAAVDTAAMPKVNPIGASPNQRSAL